MFQNVSVQVGKFTPKCHILSSARLVVAQEVAGSSPVYHPSILTQLSLFRDSLSKKKSLGYRPDASTRFKARNSVISLEDVPGLPHITHDRSRHQDFDGREK